MALRLFTNWSQEGVFCRPARGNAVPKCKPLNAKNTTPFGHVFSDAVKREWSIVAFVVRLLLLRRPSAIRGFVIAVSVNAVNGMKRRWPVPHVGKKPSKIIPFLANGNTSSAVVFKGFALLIQASLAHARPNAVFGRMGQVVFPVSIPQLVSEETSATGRYSDAQTMRSDRFKFAAIAKALPPFLAVRVNALWPIGNVKRNQPSKSLPCQVVRFSHDSIISQSMVMSCS